MTDLTKLPLLPEEEQLARINDYLKEQVSKHLGDIDLTDLKGTVKASIESVLAAYGSTSVYVTQDKNDPSVMVITAHVPKWLARVILD